MPAGHRIPRAASQRAASCLTPPIGVLSSLSPRACHGGGAGYLQRPHRKRAIPVLASVNPIPVGRPTFLDVPRGTDLTTLDAHVAIVGLPFSVPYDLYRSTIASTSPQAIREQSMR